MKNNSKSHSKSRPPAVCKTEVQTRLGRFCIEATEQGISSIAFADRSGRRKQSVVPPIGRARKHLSACSDFLTSYCSGRIHRAGLVAIDWRRFTPFERKVLQNLRRVPYGETISYSGLAVRAKVPRAARAVGNALSQNPIPILLPCHRVIQKSGSLGGYRGGIAKKKILLSLERR